MFPLLLLVSLWYWLAPVGVHGPRRGCTPGRSTYARDGQHPGLHNNHYVDSINTDSAGCHRSQEYLNVTRPSTVSSSFWIPLQLYSQEQGFSRRSGGQLWRHRDRFNILNNTILVVTALSGGPSENWAFGPAIRSFGSMIPLVAGIGDKYEVTSMLRERGTVVEAGQAQSW